MQQRIRDIAALIWLQTRPGSGRQNTTAETLLAEIDSRFSYPTFDLIHAAFDLARERGKHVQEAIERGSPLAFADWDVVLPADWEAAEQSLLSRAQAHG